MTATYWADPVMATTYGPPDIKKAYPWTISLGWQIPPATDTADETNKIVRFVEARWGDEALVRHGHVHFVHRYHADEFERMFRGGSTLPFRLWFKRGD